MAAVASASQPAPTSGVRLASDGFSVDELLHVPWYLYRTSPLHKINLGADALVRASRQLTQFLRVENGEEMLDDEHISLETEEPLPETTAATVFTMNFPEGSDKTVLSVRAHYRAARSDVGSDVEVYLPILSRNEDSMDAPVVLGRGHGRVLARVLRWLSKKYDCYMGKLTLAPFALNSMLRWFVDATSARYPLQVTLSFPQAQPHLRNVTITVPPDGLSTMFESYADASDRRTIQPLERYLQRFFGIDAVAAQLVKISSARGTISCDGRMKLHATAHFWEMIELIHPFTTASSWMQAQ